VIDRDDVVQLAEALHAAGMSPLLPRTSGVMVSSYRSEAELLRELRVVREQIREQQRVLGELYGTIDQMIAVLDR
jgi:hypothetical protein